jgi:hypothetical protein
LATDKKNSDIRNNAKELPMNLQSWDGTINQIANESNCVPSEAEKYKVLTNWRAKLQEEPSSLPPYQIDQIVREVRKKLLTASR